MNNLIQHCLNKASITEFVPYAGMVDVKTTIDQEEFAILIIQECINAINNTELRIWEQKARPVIIDNIILHFQDK